MVNKIMNSFLNNRRVLRDRLICIPTFDRPAGICDFVFQVARDLAHQNVVIILALGENWRGRSGWQRWYQVLRQLRQKNAEKNSEAYFYIGLFQFVPLQRIKMLRELNTWLNLTILQLVLTHSFKKTSKMLWVFHPDDTQVLSSFPSPTWHLHFDAVDWHTSCFLERQKRIDRERRHLISVADSITVLTTPVLKKIQDLTSKTVALVPQGFDIESFKETKKLPARLSKMLILLRKKETPIVGYFGGVSTRLDIDLLRNVIQQSPGLNFLFVGPRQKEEAAKISVESECLIDELLQLSNVFYYPAIQRGCLPQLMEECSALILPYDLEFDFNKCCFPMKIMEYLYATKPIISTSVPSLKTYEELIQFADTATTFSIKLSEAVGTTLSKEQKQNARQIVLNQTWPAKLDSVDVYLYKMLRST